MDEGGEDRTPAASAPRSVTAAMIVMCRYLAGTSPGFAAYLKQSIDHAAAAGVTAEDLMLLRTLLASLGNEL